MKHVPVLFLDLDGTVRHGFDELGRFVNSAADVRVFDEVPALLKRYRAAGWRVVACSNQGGIALGHLTLEDCLSALEETDRQCGEAFDVVEFCPHYPGQDISCWCHKPRPGLVYQALFHLQAGHQDETYRPHLSLFVGDRAEDRGCAESAGVPFMEAADWRAGKHSPEVAQR